MKGEITVKLRVKYTGLDEKEGLEEVRTMLEGLVESDSIESFEVDDWELESEDEDE